MTELPQRVCIKAEFLRYEGFQNLREFDANETNARMCRAGRIFIKEKNGKMKPYHYRASRFANPYSLADHTRKEALDKYGEYLDKMLREDETAAEEFNQLRSKKRLGCFCEPFQACHVDVIIDRMNDSAKKRKLK
jgi:hypothetical protein